MKKISREQAEQLFLNTEVIDSTIHQDKDQLRVVMNLSSNQSCHVTYDFKSNKKNYYLDISSVPDPDNAIPTK
jgi:hypothetical protein